MGRGDELPLVQSRLVHDLGVRIDCPPRLFKQFAGRHGTGHRVNQVTIGCQEMTGYISAPLGDLAADIDGAKVADLMMR